MKDLIVTTSCTHRYGLLDILERQLDRAGINFFIGTMSGSPPSWEQTIHIERRLCEVSKMVDQFATDYRLMAFIDSRDMLFVGTEDDVISKIPQGDRILMAADRHCWPEEKLAGDIPQQYTPWRFNNFGGIAGRIEAIGRWVSDIRVHPTYEEGVIDQAITNRILANPDPFFDIDYETNLFYCMHRDEGEFDLSEQRPRNKLTGKYPNFIHFNGKSDPKEFLAWLSKQLHNQRL